MDLAPLTLTELVVLAFAPNTPAEGRLDATNELLRRLSIMARHVAGSDHDLVSEIVQHVWVQLLRGKYEPRPDRPCESWVWVVMRRYCWDARRLKIRWACEAELTPELATAHDDRHASDLHVDFSTRFGPDDDARILAWTAGQRFVLLTWALLWRKVDPIRWAETLAEVGVAGPFPGPGFEHRSDSERRRIIAQVLGVATNSVTQALKRGKEQLRGLRFLRELGRG